MIQNRVTKFGSATKWWSCQGRSSCELAQGYQVSLMEEVFLLYSLQLIIWAWKKLSIFETPVSLLNQIANEFKTLKMDLQLKAHHTHKQNYLLTIKFFFFRKSNGKKMAQRSLCGLKSPPSFSLQLQKNLVEFFSSPLLTSFMGKNKCVFELKKKKNKVFVLQKDSKGEEHKM